MGLGVSFGTNLIKPNLKIYIFSEKVGLGGGEGVRGERRLKSERG